MVLLQFIWSILNGFIDLLLAIPRLLVWLYDLYTAEARSSEAMPLYLELEEELRELKLLKAFNSLLKGVADIRTAAPDIVSSNQILSKPETATAISWPVFSSTIGPPLFPWFNAASI